MFLNVIRCELNSISVMFFPNSFHLNVIKPLEISSGSGNAGDKYNLKNIIRKQSDKARMKNTQQDN